MGCDPLSGDPFSDPLNPPQPSDPLGIALGQFDTAVSTTTTDYTFDLGAIFPGFDLPIISFSITSKTQPVQTIQQLPGSAGMIAPAVPRSLGDLKIPKLPAKLQKAGSSQVLPYRVLRILAQHLCITDSTGHELR